MNLTNRNTSASDDNDAIFDEPNPFVKKFNDWFGEDNPHATRNIIVGVCVAIVFIVLVCFLGSMALSSISGSSPEATATEAPAPTEAPVATEPPAAVVNPTGKISIKSVLPGVVEAGSDVKIVFDFAPADGTTVQDYVFKFVGPDKKTVLKEGVSPSTEFAVKTPNEAGQDVVVGYVVAEHKTDSAKNAEMSRVSEDLTAPIVVAPAEPLPTEPPVVESQPAADANGCPARVTIEPPANAFVNAEDGKVYSFSYKLEEDRPYDVTVPCGSVSTMAFGNATINGHKFTASEVEGNVVYTTCDAPLGCKYRVEDFTAGHFIVTIVYPGMEEPVQSVFNAVDNMFNPSNCGGSGCPTAFLTDAEFMDQTVTFDKRPAIGEISINDFAVKPTTGSVIGEPTTKTIKVNGVEVGQVYSLESKELQYIGVPEQHDGFVTGLYIECPSGCVIYGTTLKSGESAEVYGNSGDNGSPNDLNWTVGVQSDAPETVKVFFIYADDVDNYAGKPTYKFNSNGVMK